MTASELKIVFNIELDAVASGAAPGFTDSEISTLLTKSQRDFIELKIKAGEWDDVYTLLATDGTILSAGIYSTKTRKSAIPADFGYYCTSRIRIYRSNPTIQNEWLGCDRIEPTIINKFLSTAFNFAYFKYPVIFFSDEDDTGYINTIVDYYTDYEEDGNNNFELTYIKLPLDVDVTSQTLMIPDKYHNKVVSMAVEEAVKSLKIAKVSTQ